MKTYLVSNDWQIGWEDKKVIDKLFFPFLEWLKPDVFVWNGDITDFYALSEFSKNPLSEDTIVSERKTTQEYMRRVKSYKFIKERYWLGGNHEDRFRRYIWKNAKALGLDADVTLADLFDTKGYGFVYSPYGSVHKAGKLDITHGSIVRQHSGWSGKAHYDKRGGSVLIGHTHRMGIYYRSNAKGVHAAYENGCLCQLNPEYVQDPDWQQGFAVVHVGTNGYFSVQQIPVVGGTRIHYGKDVFTINGKET